MNLMKKLVPAKYYEKYLPKILSVFRASIWAIMRKKVYMRDGCCPINLAWSCHWNLS